MSQWPFSDQSLVFLGDIAIPRRALVRAAPTYPALCSDPYAFAIANLEGPLRTDEGSGQQGGLFSSTELLTYLQTSNVRVVSLANNHIFDAGLPFASTLAPLRTAGIAPLGIGRDLSEAAREVRVATRTRDVAFLSFGWRVIGCRPAGPASAGVNPLTPEWVMHCVREARSRLPAATRLVVLCHWNYELELYPQPMHRQLAHTAVQHGADLVVGCHAHCPHGLERVNGRWIVYGLGNWLLSAGEFMGGTLRYPALTQLELALRWDPETLDVRCEWFHYDPDTHGLRLLQVTDPSDCDRTRDLTPFAGMSHAQYTRWFVHNRRKNKLLPVFRDCETPRINRAKELWVAARHLGITALRGVAGQRSPS